MHDVSACGSLFVCGYLVSWSGDIWVGYAKLVASYAGKH